GLQKLFEEKETLKTLNKNLSAVIDVSYDGIYITDKHGKTLKTNSAIERITGIPKEYYIGKNVDELIDRGILRGSVTHLVQKNKRTASQENIIYVKKDSDAYLKYVSSAKYLINNDTFSDYVVRKPEQLYLQ